MLPWKYCFEKENDFKFEAIWVCLDYSRGNSIAKTVRKISGKEDSVSSRIVHRNHLVHRSSISAWRGHFPPGRSDINDRCTKRFLCIILLLTPSSFPDIFPTVFAILFPLEWSRQANSNRFKLQTSNHLPTNSKHYFQGVTITVTVVSMTLTDIVLTYT